MTIDSVIKTTRRRLPRNERERLIIEEAVRFFAEVGFEGQTRALAQRLGVTQPLLYRYFPDKEALIERVYQEVFEGGWDVVWEQWLSDRSRPLAERLRAVYGGYVRANFSYERVRLFMYVGLKEQAIANRYLAFLRERLFVPIAQEVRAAAGLDENQPLQESEIEVAAGLHGAISYVGVRCWVYETGAALDVPAAITTLINAFVDGAVESCRKSDNPG